MRESYMIVIVCYCTSVPHGSHITTNCVWGQGWVEDLQRILCSTTDGRTALGVEYYNIIHGYNTQWGSLELYK